VTGWLIAILAGLGALALGVVKADLEDATVCRWLARRLIFRAARRLPDGERDRWREEAISNILDLPGRLLPLWWALDTYLHAGRWGRMRGAPSRWQVLIAQLQAAWQRLRTLRQERARALSKQRHPASIRLQGDPAQVSPVALGAGLAARGVTHSTGSATLGYSPNIPFAQYRGSLRHLSDEEVVALLSQSPQEFVADLDRRVEEWRRERWRLLGREPE